MVTIVGLVTIQGWLQVKVYHRPGMVKVLSIVIIYESNGNSYGTATILGMVTVLGTVTVLEMVNIIVMVRDTK